MTNNQPFRILETIEICFSCGERMPVNSLEAVERLPQSELICSACSEASGKSSAHYYMMQYYYRFAD
ncbi:hypothetical protein [Paenibacillus xanthanilyticus]|uniref:Inhibitor of sigma-G Gin n=1 Tax=Paenibacillus xanthanilyticus TaxID=1783531 RepID=A0ABV8K7G7_9BACL